MLKPQERIINLRTVLFLTFILIIISGLLFKYLEWTVLRQTLKTYNASWAREFNDASAISKKGDDMLEVASELLIAIEAEKVDIENINADTKFICTPGVIPVIVPKMHPIIIANNISSII